ncbi:hypothetical protein M513_04335, partial [Trichuris suis]
MCYEEAEFISVFALRRICGGVIRCYEERGKDTIALSVCFVRSLPQRYSCYCRSSARGNYA